MEQNTREIVDLYNKLGAAVGPDGNPILSVTQVQQTTTTTYMQQRVFDASTGVEAGPILTPIDTGALQSSLDELANDQDTINAISALVAQASPAQAVQVKVVQLSPAQKVG